MKKIHKAWYIALACFLLSGAAMGVVANGLTYFVAPLCAAWGIGRTEISVAISAMTIASAVSGMVIVGPIYRKFGIKKPAIVANLIVGTSLIVCSFVGGATSLAIVFAVMGLGGAMAGISACVILINNWFVKNKGTITGLVLSASGFMGIIMAQIVPRNIENLGYGKAFFINAIIYLCMTVPFMLFVKDSPKECGLQPYGADESPANTNTAVNSAGKAALSEGLSVSQILRHPAFWLLAVGYLCWTFSGAGYAHLQASMTNKGVETAILANAMSGYSLALMVGKIIHGWLSDHIGTEKSMGIGLISFVTAYILLSTSAASQPVLLAACMLLGFGISSNTVYLPLFFGKAFGRGKSYATLYPVINSTISLGIALGTTAYGVMYDAFGGTYTPAFRIGACGLVIAYVLIILSSAISKKRKAVYEG